MPCGRFTSTAFARRITAEQIWCDNFAKFMAQISHSEVSKHWYLASWLAKMRLLWRNGGCHRIWQAQFFD